MWIKKLLKKNKWLSDPGSTTQKLKEKEMKITLINNKIVTNSFEKELYFKKNRGVLHLREVLISSQKKPLIYARTIVDYSLMKRNIPSLFFLKNKPLGDILYENNFFRTKFDYLSSIHNSYLKNFLIKNNLDIKKVLGVRKSFFIKAKIKIMLIEIFFKDIEKI